MSTTPHTALCARCSARLTGWTDACANCGYVAGVSPAADRSPASPARPRTVPQAPTPLVPAVPPPPPHFGHPQAPVHVIAAKSPGVAVALCLLWLGPGALYVGQTGLGIGLLVFSGFLALLSLIPFAMFLTVPVWWIAFILVAVHVSNEATAFNRRNGIVVH